MSERMRIVVIGGVAAGPKAAARARRLMPNAEITILEKSDFISYAGCGMPFYLDDQVPDFQDLFDTAYWVPRDTGYFARERGIRVLTGTEALAVDRAARQVRARDVRTGEEMVFLYDKLVIATGANPVIPPIEGINLKGVFKLKEPSDAQAIKEYLPEVQEAVVVGAGFIGMEVAGALANLKILTTVVEFQDQVLPGVLDPDMALLFKTRLQSQGIEFLVSEKVMRFEGDENGRLTRVVTDKRVLDAELALV
ncbi:NAD(P)/FAD-dependent oxidoreductase, partial [Desulforudis sp. 1190]